jgi:hypothetical protein
MMMSNFHNEHSSGANTFTIDQVFHSLPTSQTIHKKLKEEGGNSLFVFDQRSEGVVSGYNFNLIRNYNKLKSQEE